MRYTIIQDDGVVGVDGVFRRVDLSGLDPEIHAIQFDTAKELGHIEYDAELEPRKDNDALKSFAAYQLFVDRWTAAAPIVQPPTAQDDVAAKKGAALTAIQEQQLTAAMSDPNAPQAVKDYAAAVAELARLERG